MSSHSSWRSLGAEIAAFLFAATCAGCDLPGTMLCDACRRGLAPDPRRLLSPSGLPLRAALPFDGVVARCIRRLKGQGETLLAGPLGQTLASVLLPELGDGIRPVPVPTARAAFRRRGYRVPELLISAAGAEPWSVLRHTGRHVDQRALGAGERAENVRGSMRARGCGDGARVVLVDDVITTGATVDEAARVLDGAGFEVVAAVSLAVTERHSSRRGNTSATRRK